MNKIIEEILIQLPDPYYEINFITRKKGWKMGVHTHTYFQAIMVTEGILNIITDKNKYNLEKGEFCIIPPSKEHKLFSLTGYSQFGINFSKIYQDTNEQFLIMSLLKNNINDFLTVNKTDFLSQIPLIRKEIQELTLLAKLKIINKVQKLFLSTLDIKVNSNMNFREKLLNILNANLNTKISLKQVARKMSFSQTHLERLTKKEFGCGVIQLLNQLKINKACSMLINRNENIGTIAESLGFYDQSYFTRYFKEKTGYTPGQYRKEKRL